MEVIFSIKDEVRWFDNDGNDDFGVVCGIDVIEGVLYCGDDVQPSNMVCYKICNLRGMHLIPQERLARNSKLSSASDMDFWNEMTRRGYL